MLMWLYMVFAIDDISLIAICKFFSKGKSIMMLSNINTLRVA